MRSPAKAKRGATLRRETSTRPPPVRKPRRPLRVPGARAVGTWLGRHAHTLVASLGRLARQPLATAMTMAVIGIALALPAGLQLLVTNLKGVTGQWDDGIELSLYLQPGTPLARARELADELRARSEVGGVELIAADAALARFRAESGLGEALDALQANPLPHLIALRPAPGHDDPASLDALAAALRALPEADLVQADTEWVRRLYAMLDVARRLAYLAGAMLAVGVVVIVGNTIRLDIQSRRDEIEVTKLIGATDGFIRRPFLYGGLWYGLGGGLVALALLYIGLATLSGPVARLAGLYGSSFRPEGPGPAGSLALVAAGALLGWLGSWVSATRHMRRIEPGQ